MIGRRANVKTVGSMGMTRVPCPTTDFPERYKYYLKDGTYAGVIWSTKQRPDEYQFHCMWPFSYEHKGVCRDLEWTEACMDARLQLNRKDNPSYA
jgi:hypothetical protein